MTSSEYFKFILSSHSSHSHTSSSLFDVKMTTPPHHLPESKPTADQVSEVVEFRQKDNQTASHELANADPDKKGAAQLEHGDAEVRDLGWNEEARSAPEPLVGGLSNEELWILIRRFNKQMFHVKSIRDAPVNSLFFSIRGFLI